MCQLVQMFGVSILLENLQVSNIPRFNSAKVQDSLTDLSRSSKMSGRRKFNRDHSSDRLFCNGVPVSSNRFAALYVFNSLTTTDEQQWLQLNKYTFNVYSNRSVCDHHLLKVTVYLQRCLMSSLNCRYPNPISN